MEIFNPVQQITDHLFRNESKKMIAVLTKIFGTENLQTAEDVVQDTLIQAMQTWKLKGIPANPAAWLYYVAKNKAIDVIRRNKHSVQFDFSDADKILLTSEYTLKSAIDELWNDELIADDLLRMMYACCHPEISVENQITLILKTLCGFSTTEIAKAFLTSEDSISKRIYRTKEFFRKNKIQLVIPTTEDIEERTNAVLNSIYLLFNEGYNSASSEELIRKDVMEEAMLLGKLLTENKYTQQPGVYALVALMCFHSSRSSSRISAEGEIILLAEQDRTKWNADLIREGNDYMNKAISQHITPYHLEAAIAYEHCIAKSFDQTNWPLILEYYTWLTAINSSPVTELNKIIVVMQVHGPEAALQMISALKNNKKLDSYYLYQGIMGEIQSRLNHPAKAQHHFNLALGLTGSEKEKKILRNKINAIAV